MYNVKCNIIYNINNVKYFPFETLASSQETIQSLKSFADEEIRVKRTRAV